MKETLKPIGFANGDGGTGRVADIVRKSIFYCFPTLDAPLTVDERISTNDNCINEAVEAFLKCGAGFKNSTASNDPAIREKGWKSANIKMRPMLNCFALSRMLQGPGRYENKCGVLRYAHGGFYDEQTCVVKKIEGRNVAVITQHLDLDDLVHFAALAIDQSKKHNFRLIISSKSTIAASESIFRETIERYWKEQGLLEGEETDSQGNKWTNDFHHELTDIGFARLPIEIASGKTMYSKGKFLYVADNANGDCASDIIDFQHGNFVMGSTCYCRTIEGTQFTYDELSTGTADAMATGPLRGNKFLNPTAIIFSICSAFEQVNPSLSTFFDLVREQTLHYIANVPKEERDTEEMIDLICEAVNPYAVV